MSMKLAKNLVIGELEAWAREKTLQAYQKYEKEVSLARAEWEYCHGQPGIPQKCILHPIRQEATEASMWLVEAGIGRENSAQRVVWSDAPVSAWRRACWSAAWDPAPIWAQEVVEALVSPLVGEERAAELAALKAELAHIGLSY